MDFLASGLEICLKRQLCWAAKAQAHGFLVLVSVVMDTVKKMARPDPRVSELCYTVGWGLYWHMDGNAEWMNVVEELEVFGHQCLRYYCSAVEVQQKSIFTFLMAWNQLTKVKEIGVMIAKIVWVGRDESLINQFGGRTAMREKMQE
jgi:hypothetical protein